ncbi:MAG TPA: hypothetical protein VMT32_19160 [Bryobacteraceae bacterium]|nr:hypothetical protein [Bryobacteraceae bacterium]
MLRTIPMRRRVLMCAVILPIQIGLAQQAGADYRSLTGEERAGWVVKETVGPQSLLGGTISAGWGTLFNSPKEYGPHWAGFGKRYGMRLTGVSASNTMEAALGALWGEDPRYSRAPERPFKGRVGNVVKMTFLARNHDGRDAPAYARYFAISGSNFLSNNWRPDSVATTGNALQRIVFGFLGRMSSNAFDEFWPDAKRLLHKKKDAPGSP